MRPFEEINSDYIKGVMDAVRFLRKASDNASNEERLIDMGAIDWASTIENQLLGGAPKITEKFELRIKSKAVKP